MRQISESQLQEQFENAGFTVTKLAKERPDGRGVDYQVQYPNGRIHEIYLAPFSLNSRLDSIKIPKDIWNHETPNNAWIAASFYKKDWGPYLYLIPLTIWDERDDEIFKQNDIPQNPWYSNYELRVFNGLSKHIQPYKLADQVNNLKD